MTGDIRDNWPSMSSIGFQQTGREQFAGPAGWNDTDMLVVGMVGWSQGTRPTDLTPNEQLTHMALWALQAAPLLIGADLSKIDDVDDEHARQSRDAGGQSGRARQSRPAAR